MCSFIYQSIDILFLPVGNVNRVILLWRFLMESSVVSSFGYVHRSGIARSYDNSIL